MPRGQKRRDKRKLERQGVDIPWTVETFRRPGAWDRAQLQSAGAYCHNGTVGIRRYRITVEEIDEPVEVLRERVQDLWDRATNMHDWRPLREAAAALDYELKGNPGGKRGT